VKKSYLAILVVLLVLIIDQWLKFYVKTTMFIGEEHNVIGHWFKLHFTENEGMAFGLRIGGVNGKLILSLFRIVACFFITYYLYKLIKRKAPTGLIISLSLILAGALGNIIDSAVYGLIFSDTNHTIGHFMPEGGGYASFLHGKVVDMLYFTFYRGTLPKWIPVYGGKFFEFFRPVFNVADTSITTGVLCIILFQRKFFGHTEKAPVETSETEATDTQVMNSEPPMS